MTLTRPRLAALAGVIGLVALTGCGGGGASNGEAAGSVAADRNVAGDAAPRASMPLQDTNASGFAGKGTDGAPDVVQKAVIKNGAISMFKVTGDKLEYISTVR